MITITDAAVEKIKELSDEEDLGHYTVRLKTRGGGCSGFENDLSFDDQINDADEIVEKDGVKVVVDCMSYQYLENATVDYIGGLMGSGFKITSPDFQGGCGCGRSFSA